MRIPHCTNFYWYLFQSSILASKCMHLYFLENRNKMHIDMASYCSCRSDTMFTAAGWPSCDSRISQVAGKQAFLVVLVLDESLSSIHFRSWFQNYLFSLLFALFFGQLCFPACFLFFASGFVFFHYFACKVPSSNTKDTFLCVFEKKNTYIVVLCGIDKLSIFMIIA